MSNFSQLVGILIQDEMNGSPHHERIIELGNTPKILIDEAGFPGLKLAVNGKVISKACFDHGIKTSVIKRLPELIDAPKSIFSSASHAGSSVVITIEMHKGHPIIIPIHKNKSAGRGANYNLVASMYAKEGPDPEIKWKQQGLLIWKA